MVKQYKVTFTRNGRRLETDDGLFKGKAQAIIYADALKENLKGSNPRVVFR